MDKRDASCNIIGERVNEFFALRPIADSRCSFSNATNNRPIPIAFACKRIWQPFVTVALRRL